MVIYVFLKELEETLSITAEFFVRTTYDTFTSLDFAGIGSKNTMNNGDTDSNAGIPRPKIPKNPKMAKKF